MCKTAFRGGAIKTSTIAFFESHKKVLHTEGLFEVVFTHPQTTRNVVEMLSLTHAVDKRRSRQ